MATTLYEFDGEKLTSVEIAKRANLPITLIRSRLSRHKTGAKLVERPVSLREAARRGKAGLNMDKERKYTITGMTGTMRELYTKVIEGVENPPTYGGFRRRVQKGEQNLADLRRAPNKTSEKGIKQKTNAGKESAKIRKKRVKQQAQEPAIKIEEQWLEQKNISGGIKLTWGKPYFRPGSLDAWPNLRKTGG